MADKQRVPDLRDDGVSSLWGRGVTWLLTLLLYSGCAMSGAPNERPDTPWTEPWRTKAANTQQFGVDQQARDIERNLGVY
jgi:hypothetical protein